jgi:hypothetical protein
MIAPGLTVASRLLAPSSRASSHAAASAIVFDRVYGVRVVSAPSVQSASVYGACGVDAREEWIAASAEVRTTRSTPPSRAARSTRNAPSRAGTISSSGSLGCVAGNGDATCSTYRHPSTAAAHPSSAVSSAATTESRSPASAPAAATAERTLGSPRRSRTVVLTVCPRRSSSATHQPPRNPVPPVTSTVPSCSAICGAYFATELQNAQARRLI